MSLSSGARPPPQRLGVLRLLVGLSLLPLLVDKAGGCLLRALPHLAAASWEGPCPHPGGGLPPVEGNAGSQRLLLPTSLRGGRPGGPRGTCLPSRWLQAEPDTGEGRGHPGP